MGGSGGASVGEFNCVGCCQARTDLQIYRFIKWTVSHKPGQKALSVLSAPHSPIALIGWKNPSAPDTPLLEQLQPGLCQPTK
eukprot:1160064-Pelagomonas_calceolata.AAC.2